MYKIMKKSVHKIRGQSYFLKHATSDQSDKTLYFQECSNSVYPQHSGERYRTMGLWFSFDRACGWPRNYTNGTQWIANEYLPSFKFRGCSSLSDEKKMDYNLHVKNIYQHLSHDITKPAKWLCAQRRLRSAWASAQSDQSLRCPLEESLGP